MKRLNPLVILILCSSLLGAAAVPKASEKPATNLERYLEYRTQGKLDFDCFEHKTQFVCESREQSFATGDGNASTVAFKEGSVRYNAALGLLLQQALFEATMREIEESERLLRQHLASKKPYLAPPSTPLKDALERGIVANLERIEITGLSYRRAQPETEIEIASVTLVDDMKRATQQAAFAERILGEIRLAYTDAVIKKIAPDALSNMLPEMLESWFDTNNTARASYVGSRLDALYAEQLHSPYSGSLRLATTYEGNDTLALTFQAENGNRKGTRDSLDFRGALRNISAFFTAARRPATGTGGAPDFLFTSLQTRSGTDNHAYRALLKDDRRFAAYIGEYDALLRSWFDAKLGTYAYSAVLSQWLSQAKNALSRLLRGDAASLDVTVKNRSGLGTMQIAGMLLKRLMGASYEGERAPTGEKLIADTAAAHLDLRIEAH